MERMEIDEDRVASDIEQARNMGAIIDREHPMCPGTNIKPGDDVLIFGSPARVMGATPDPDYFAAAIVDDLFGGYATITFPCGSYDNQLITDRAPIDPNDTDPVYPEPTP